MESDPNFSTEKTVIVMVVIVGFFAYLWSGTVAQIFAPKTPILSSEAVPSTLDKKADTSSEAKSQSQVTYYLYFNHDPSSEDECSALYPVARTETVYGGVEASALVALMSGPDAAERQNGFDSLFSSKTATILDTVKVRGEEAYVNFSNPGQKIPSADLRCTRETMTQAVTKTLTQFGTIKKVHYTINGSAATWDSWVKRGN